MSERILSVVSAKIALYKYSFFHFLFLTVCLGYNGKNGNRTKGRGAKTDSSDLADHHTVRRMYFDEHDNRIQLTNSAQHGVQQRIGIPRIRRTHDDD